MGLYCYFSSDLFSMAKVMCSLKATYCTLVVFLSVCNSHLSVAMSVVTSLITTSEKFVLSQNSWMMMDFSQIPESNPIPACSEPQTSKRRAKDALKRPVLQIIHLRTKSKANAVTSLRRVNALHQERWEAWAQSQLSTSILRLPVGSKLIWSLMQD